MSNLECVSWISPRIANDKPVKSIKSIQQWGGGKYLKTKKKKHVYFTGIRTETKIKSALSNPTRKNSQSQHRVSLHVNIYVHLCRDLASAEHQHIQKVLWVFSTRCSCSHATGHIPVQWKLPFDFVVLHVYENYANISNDGVRGIQFKALLQKLKSCINTMESTDTASIQWGVIYRVYEVIVALDVWHCISMCRCTGSSACPRYRTFPLRPSRWRFLEMRICSSLPTKTKYKVSIL